MDTRTLLIAALTSSLATNFCMMTVLWTRITYSGFGYWTAGTFCWTLGTGLFLFPCDQFPPWLTMVSANFSMVLGLMLHSRGVLAFRGLNPGYAWEILASLSLCAVLAYYAYVSPNPGARIIVCTLCTGTILLYTVYTLLRHRPDYFGSSDILLALSLGLLAIFNLSRAGYTYAFGVPVNEAMIIPTLHGLVIFIPMLLMMLIIVSEIMMNAQRLEGEIAGKKLAEDSLRESEEKFRLAFDNANTGICLVDLTGKLFKVNSKLSFILGYGKHEFEGLSVNDFTLPEDSSVSLEFIHRAIKGEIDCATFEKRYRHKQGHIIYGQVSSSLVRDSDGTPLYFISQLQDITERRCIEEELRRSLADIQRHDTQMITLNRMNERLLSCETREEAYEVIGHGAGTLLAPFSGALAICQDDTNLKVVVSWGDAKNQHHAIQAKDCQAFRLGKSLGGNEEGSCQFFQDHPERTYLCLPLMVRTRTLGVLHLSVDGNIPMEAFQELKTLATTLGESIKLTVANLQLQEVLREQAIRDPLTGLFNRRYLDATLPREFSRCQRSGEPLTVAMLDLDHFKRFNDTHGHEAGDAVLRKVGEMLIRHLRSSDIACRYGGEEMTVVMPVSSMANASRRLETLRQQIEQFHILRQGEILKVTVSIGVAEARTGDDDARLLLRRADCALYQAKAQGRNRVVMAQA